MNVIGTCSTANENYPAQTLAVVLSIVFSIYIGLAILLSSLQLHTITSEATAATLKRNGNGMTLLDVS